MVMGAVPIVRLSWVGPFGLVAARASKAATLTARQARSVGSGGAQVEADSWQSESVAMNESTAKSEIDWCRRMD